MKTDLGLLKRQIIEAGKRAYARSYVAAKDGNISVRVDKKKILITPLGISKGFMKKSDLVLLDMNGRIVNGTKKPSSELYMHLQIYKERSDINSVCHLHPPYATGFAAAGIPLDQYVLIEAEMALGKIPLIEYAPPGTEQLFRKLIPFLQNSKAFLLANHGALTVGTDIFDAYNNMETLEHTAYILFIARRLGNLSRLNAGQIKDLNALSEKYRREIR